MKKARETVAEMIRRRNYRAPDLKPLPKWVFSWWPWLIFVLVVLVLPVALAIFLTFPS